jgi:anaerobic ribonucleoside-triphosphate reductase activating protein
MNSFLNVAHRIPCTGVEGPGLRFALWVQGCDIGCPGCCNQKLLAFEKRYVLAASEITREIQQSKRSLGIEGVTFIGGEPAYQAKGLADIASACQVMGLSVFLFTGFRIERLRRIDLPGVERLLRYTDVVVDGPYVSARPDKVRNWVGSENQRFHYLTNRYDSGIETNPDYSASVELHISPDGGLHYNGFPL